MKRGRIAAAYRALEAEIDNRLAQNDGNELDGINAVTPRNNEDKRKRSSPSLRAAVRRRGNPENAAILFRKARRLAVSSEITELENLLKGTPESHVIERLSLQHRLAAVRKQLSGVYP